MLEKIKTYYDWGGRFLTSHYHIEANKISELELQKKPIRTDVINYLLSLTNDKETRYLEVGVRNPEHNYNLIKSSHKISVDPGIEFKENPVDYKLESDEFFEKCREGKVPEAKTKFDVIFIDGLHLANQVEKDIQNSLEFISDEGFIVLHDCNPPTEWHAREEYGYDLSPAMHFWNGTTWKAFYKYRFREDLTSVCVDTDWGVGIITKQKLFNSLKVNNNPFYEFKELEKNRTRDLNLISFDELIRLTQK